MLAYNIRCLQVTDHPIVGIKTDKVKTIARGSHLMEARIETLEPIT